MLLYLIPLSTMLQGYSCLATASYTLDHDIPRVYLHCYHFIYPRPRCPKGISAMLPLHIPSTTIFQGYICIATTSYTLDHDVPRVYLPCYRFMYPRPRYSKGIVASLPLHIPSTTIFQGYSCLATTSYTLDHDVPRVYLHCYHFIYPRLRYPEGIGDCFQHLYPPV